MRKFTDSRAPQPARNDIRPRYRPEQPRNTAFETHTQKFSNIERNAKPEVPQKNIYERPAWRAGMRDKVWEQAKDTHGRVRDPVSGKYMSKNQPWDMGHKPGYEFKKHQENAAQRGISREKFIDEYNNPDHLRPELPSSNRSHKGENRTGEYFGDSTANRVELAVNTLGTAANIVGAVKTATELAQVIAPVAKAALLLI